MIEKLCKNCFTSYRQYNTTQTLCPKCVYNKYSKPKKPIKLMGKVAKQWVEYRQDWIKRNMTTSGTWLCYLCGVVLTLNTLTLDHIIPRSARPDLRFDDRNIKPCCYRCNSQKGSKH